MLLSLAEHNAMVTVELISLDTDHVGDLVIRSGISGDTHHVADLTISSTSAEIVAL